MWFGIDSSYPKSAFRVTDVLAQKPTLRVTYVVAHRGNRCPDTCQLRIKDLKSTSKTQEVLLGRKLFSLVAKECGYMGNEIAEYLEKDPAVVTAYSKEAKEFAKRIKELTNYLRENKSKSQ